MPKEMEAALRRRANALARAGKLRGGSAQTTEEAKNSFIYGTMRRKAGWVPSSQKSGRGKQW